VSLSDEQWVQLLRSDCRGRLLDLVRELMLTANWDTWESWPGWDRLMDVTGWARSTLAGWLRQLRLLGWLSVIESGSTPQFRPMALAHVEGNRRAVYALRVPRRPGEQREAPQPPARPEPHLETVPAEPPTRSDQRGRASVDRTWTPTWFFISLKESFVGSSSRATDFFHSSQPSAQAEPKTEPLRGRFDEEWLAFARTSPTSGAQMLAAAAELRRQEPILARLTARAVRALCRPYWAAGWANDDVRHALRWRPRATSSLPAMEQAKIHAPYRWAQSRLAAWRTETGKVLPGDSHMERAQRTREHAVVARYGKAALAAMPAGSDRLRPVDVRRFGRRRVDAAVETLRRRRAAELTDERTAVRPLAAAADPEHARRVAEEFRTSRERCLAATPENAWSQAADPGIAERYLSACPEERREAALARARAEGRVPLTRRRRRTRW
jgi:hypothetical protein